MEKRGHLDWDAWSEGRKGEEVEGLKLVLGRRRVGYNNLTCFQHGIAVERCQDIFKNPIALSSL